MRKGVRRHTESAHISPTYEWSSAVLEGPSYRGRSPAQIISEDIFFDSVGFIYRALSWLDIAKTDNNVCAFQYAAHDTRQAIEHIFFEELVLSVGSKLDQQEYENCKGKSTKLYKIVRRLNPDYEKLVKFTQAIVSVLPSPRPKIIIWNHKKLMRHSGEVSNYLHWTGEPAETYESCNWLEQGIAIVNAIAISIWDNSKSGYTGKIIRDQMPPEIMGYWQRFRAEEVDIDEVKRIARIALPVLTERLYLYQSLQ